MLDFYYNPLFLHYWKVICRQIRNDSAMYLCNDEEFGHTPLGSYLCNYYLHETFCPLGLSSPLAEPRGGEGYRSRAEVYLTSCPLSSSTNGWYFPWISCSEGIKKDDIDVRQTSHKLLTRYFLTLFISCARLCQHQLISIAPNYDLLKNIRGLLLGKELLINLWERIMCFLLFIRIDLQIIWASVG